MRLAGQEGGITLGSATLRAEMATSEAVVAAFAGTGDLKMMQMVLDRFHLCTTLPARVLLQDTALFVRVAMVHVTLAELIHIAWLSVTRRRRTARGVVLGLGVGVVGRLTLVLSVAAALVRFRGASLTRVVSTVLGVGRTGANGCNRRVRPGGSPVDAGHFAC